MDTTWSVATSAFHFSLGLANSQYKLHQEWPPTCFCSKWGKQKEVNILAAWWLLWSLELKLLQSMDRTCRGSSLMRKDDKCGKVMFHYQQAKEDKPAASWIMSHVLGVITPSGIFLPQCSGQSKTQNSYNRKCKLLLKQIWARVKLKEYFYQGGLWSGCCFDCWKARQAE